MVSDWQEKGFFTQQSLRESDGHFFIHLFRQNESNQRQDHVSERKKMKELKKKTYFEK